MRMPATWLSIQLLLSCLLLSSVASAAEPEFSADQMQFFENKVRPILVDRCYKCHGPEKQSSSLRVDSRAALMLGGDSGAAIVPGKPAESLFIEALNYESIEMPPDAKLKDEEIATLTEWVRIGAPFPGGNKGALTPRTTFEVTDEDRQFWSFQPVIAPDTPTPKHAEWIRNPIDAFILAGLEARELDHAPQASKRELIRRAYFDLIGLPPTPEEIDAFIADDSPGAYPELIDRLLDMPQYGERWARHWLDIVRFAQTNGYERDDEKPNAWRYRDYVIRSLNADKPYDQFVREQIAGDELDTVTDDSLTATAFYRLGVWDDEPDDKRQADFDELDDMVSTTGTAILGLTIGCARCHDHKFDPIPQADYYGLLAFLRNIKPYEKPSENAKESIFAVLQGGGETLAVHERGPNPPETNILIRGSAASPGPAVEPHFLEVLCNSPEAMLPTFPERPADSPTSGRRRVLANWLTSSDNPLTPRVIVNRLWHHHFGKGIVPTPSDFGKTGLPPSHPELLDYLASELIKNDWRLKPLHRRIMLSATYQQSSRVDNEPAIDVDPDNALLWRQNLRRLQAEAIRDAVLAVNGNLNLKMGGRGIFPTLAPEVLATQSRPGNGWDKSTDTEQARRSVYIFVKRTLGVPLLETFDAASPDTTTATRNTTTVAPQALILLNSNFTDEQGAAFAERILKEKVPSEDWIERGFRLAIGRSPTEQEAAISRAFLDRQRSQWNSLDLPSTKPEPQSVKLAGWSYYGGDWKLGPEASYSVEPNPGAKAIWDQHTLADGIVECDVNLLKAGGDAGLVLRVTDPQNGTDALTAYNINFLQNRLRLGKHKNNWRELTSANVELPPNKWNHLKVQLEGARIRITVNGAETPQIDYTDPEPLTEGKIGFRTFNAQTAFRNLRVTVGEKITQAEFKVVSDTTPPATLDVDPAERQALAAFCKLLLNLNEFVYID